MKIAKDLEEASGMRYQEGWLIDGGCPESDDKEKWSGRNCKREGENMANSAKGNKIG